MSGTQSGARKAVETIKRTRPDFYKQIGERGGKISRGGGFSPEYTYPDGMTGHERAVEAGRKGGLASRRTKSHD